MQNLNSVLEENIGQKLHEFGFGYNVLNVTPKTPARKEKIYKLDFVRMKKFCLSKDPIHRVKGIAQNRRKHLQIIHLIRDSYQNIRELNLSIEKQPDTKMGKVLEQTFLQRRQTDGQYAL